jgi:hypothetical protein
VHLAGRDLHRGRPITHVDLAVKGDARSGRQVAKHLVVRPDDRAGIVAGGNGDDRE